VEEVKPLISRSEDSESVLFPLDGGRSVKHGFLHEDHSSRDQHRLQVSEILDDFWAAQVTENVV